MTRGPRACATRACAAPQQPRRGRAAATPRCCTPWAWRRASASAGARPTPNTSRTSSRPRDVAGGLGALPRCCACCCNRACSRLGAYLVIQPGDGRHHHRRSICRRAPWRRSSWRSPTGGLCRGAPELAPASDALAALPRGHEPMPLPAAERESPGRERIASAPPGAQKRRAGRQLRAARQAGAGHHRPERVGQVLAGARARRRLAARCAARSVSTARRSTMVAERARPAHRLSAAGRRAVRRHGGAEHRPLRSRRDRRGGHRGGAGGRRPRHDRAAAGRLRHPDRRSRRGAVGRPAPAHRAGAGALSAIRSWWCSTSPIPTSTPRARSARAGDPGRARAGRHRGRGRASAERARRRRPGARHDQRPRPRHRARGRGSGEVVRSPAAAAAALQPVLRPSRQRRWLRLVGEAGADIACMRINPIRRICSSSAWSVPCSWSAASAAGPRRASSPAPSSRRASSSSTPTPRRCSTRPAASSAELQRARRRSGEGRRYRRPARRHADPRQPRDRHQGPGRAYGAPRARGGRARRAPDDRFPADLLGAQATIRRSPALSSGETQAVRDCGHDARRPEGAARRARRPVERRSAARGQVAAKEKQSEWVQQELEGVRELWNKNLVPINRVTSLEREQARLEGERGQLIAAIAQSKGKIAETELQILQIDQDMRSEVGKELADIRGKTAELVEKQGRRRGPAQAHRHPRAAGRHGASARRAHGRRRDHGRRADHADRARRRQADRRGQGAAAGHRPGAHRPDGRDALLRLQPAHDARGQRRVGLVRPTSRRISAPARASTRCASRCPPKRSRGSEGLKLVPGMPVEVFIQTTFRTVASYSCAVPGSDRESVPRKIRSTSVYCETLDT